MPAPIRNFLQQPKLCCCDNPILEVQPERIGLYCRGCGGNRAYPPKAKRLWHKPVAVETLTLLQMPSINPNVFGYK